MFTMQLSSQKFKLVSVAYFFSYKQLVQKVKICSFLAFLFS